MAALGRPRRPPSVPRPLRPPIDAIGTHRRTTWRKNTRRRMSETRRLLAVGPGFERRRPESVHLARYAAQGSCSDLRNVLDTGRGARKLNKALPRARAGSPGP